MKMIPTREQLKKEIAELLYQDRHKPYEDIAEDIIRLIDNDTRKETS